MLAWSGLVLLIASHRRSYSEALYGSAPLAAALSTWRQHCPNWAARLDSATARAAKSRSAAALARATGIASEELAPAAAEGTVVFRLIWPIWCPLQCWAMVKWWPWKHPQAQLDSELSAISSASRMDSLKGSMIETLDDGNLKDIE
eukprot:TRINITY_DN8612_c0_g1_i2.p1 TRINITY_DN8612_c0_g1~~TRINITY_DN8612_c0_g1_i2.p1  ORF type:complete len:146 (-),score=22.83 TRINITY_DN8612_c0_g1_i2:497-934(-)